MAYYRLFTGPILSITNPAPTPQHFSRLVQPPLAIPACIFFAYSRTVSHSSVGAFSRSAFDR